jgi:hypothetical protein
MRPAGVSNSLTGSAADILRPRQRLAEVRLAGSSAEFVVGELPSLAALLRCPLPGLLYHVLQPVGEAPKPARLSARGPGAVRFLHAEEPGAKAAIELDVSALSEAVTLVARRQPVRLAGSFAPG